MKMLPAVGTNNTRTTVTNTGSASLAEPFKTSLFSGANAAAITVLGAETVNNNIVKLHVRSALGEHSLPLSAPPTKQTPTCVLASIKAGDLVLLKQVRNGVQAAMVSTQRPGLRGGAPVADAEWEEGIEQWANNPENGPLENLEIAKDRILARYKNSGAYLDLYGLKLKKMPADLSKLRSLRALYLSDNQITNIDANALSGLTSLYDLGLGNNQINNIDANTLRRLLYPGELDLDSNSEKMQVLLSHATQLTDFALSKDNTSNNAVAPYVKKLTGCVYSSESLLCVHNRLNVLAKCGKIAKVQNGGGEAIATATAVYGMYWRAIDYIAKMAAEERGNARGFVFALIRKSRESGLIKIEHQHLLELRLTQGNHGDRLTRLEEHHRRLEGGMRLFGQQLVKRLNALELNQLSIRDSLINLRDDLKTVNANYAQAFSRIKRVLEAQGRAIVHLSESQRRTLDTIRRMQKHHARTATVRGLLNLASLGFGFG